MAIAAKKLDHRSITNRNYGTLQPVSAKLADGIVLTVGDRTENVFPATRLLSRIESIPPLRRYFDININILCQPTNANFFSASVAVLVHFFVGRGFSDTLSLFFKEEDYRPVVDAYSWFNAAILHHKQDYREAIVRNERKLFSVENDIFFALNKIIVNSDCSELYQLRSNKSENAKDFLVRVYASRLIDDSLSLSEIRNLDASLWRALRNWANHKKFDLDILLPRGKTKPGPTRSETNVLLNQLDPNDPVQQLARKELERREREKARSRRRREKKLSA